MTTIAVKNGFLASDSRITSGDEILTDDYSQKAIPLAGGGILAMAGLTGDFPEFIRAMREKRARHLAIDESSIFVLARPNGFLRLWHHVPEGIRHCDFIIPPDGLAFGSGAKFARGAMAAGVGAHRAIAIAAKFDCRTGGNVHVFNIALGTRV